MAGYTREFLIDAYVSRYEPLGPEICDMEYKLACQLYDRVGKDLFRTYASLDAAAIRKYKQLER